MSWPLKSDSQRGNRENEGGDKEHLIPSEVTSARGEGTYYMGQGQQQWPPISLSASLWSEAVISDQHIDPQYLEDSIPVFHSGSGTLCAGCCRNVCTAAWHWTGKGRCTAATVRRAKINYNLLSKSSPGSLRHSQESRVPKLYQTYSANACCSDEETDPRASYSAIFPGSSPSPCFLEKYVWLNNMAFNFLRFYLYKNCIITHNFQILKFSSFNILFQRLKHAPFVTLC